MFKWFWTIFSLGAPVVSCFLGHHFCTRCLKGLYNGSPVHFVLFCQLLALNRYGSSSVGKEITCKWQNQRLETNKYVPWALFLKFQTAEINFEKLLGWTAFAEFSKTLISIRFNLLLFCPSVASVVSVNLSFMF